MYFADRLPWFDTRDRKPMHQLPGEEGGKYVRLVDAGGLHIEVQAVHHPSRVHLDIASEDVEAEVRRLEALGAKRVAQVHSWWVMETPTGQRFCVASAVTLSAAGCCPARGHARLAGL